MALRDSFNGWALQVREGDQAVDHPPPSTARSRLGAALQGHPPEIPRCTVPKKGIRPSIYYKGSQAILDSGKNSLNQETSRDATFDKVGRLQEANEALQKAGAETVLDKPEAKKKGWACKAREVSEDAQPAQA